MKLDLTPEWFNNKTITIMGLGVHGGALALAKWLLVQGAELIVTDMKSEQDLEISITELTQVADELDVLDKLSFRLGEHMADDFIDIDMVIKNPGVRNNNKFLALARENNIPVYDEAMLFMSLVKVPVIGITGSKGKSTTTSLIGQMLQKKYPSALIAGNIKSTPLFNIIDQVILDNAEVPVVVVEFSSWQLDNFGDISLSPHVGLITNLLPEHLNSYDSFADYIKSKLNIIKFQSAEHHDRAVLNHDDEELNKIGQTLEQEVIWFSTKEKLSKGIEIRDGKELIWHEAGVEKSLGNFQTNLAGEYNLSNIAAAVSVAYAQGVNVDDILEVLAHFETLSGRREYLGNIKSRNWYNDTCATAPAAVTATLASFQEKLVLIAGGSDKASPVDELAQMISNKVASLILLPGDGSEKLQAELAKLNFTHIIKVETMDQAVAEALNSSEDNDDILLSPGFASFASFKHEFDRGDAFVRAINS